MNRTSNRKVLRLLSVLPPTRRGSAIKRSLAITNIEVSALDYLGNQNLFPFFGRFKQTPSLATGPEDALQVLHYINGSGFFS